ncbi:peptidylprolyl isomerase [Mariprofundus ferrooxydans]|uniref:peptidylprolyl isomerase n=1 Tax=Mariprofundus ferrooxydans TaxID=314344 RepID=UPI00035DFBC3|nr:peptidylprolyl isomerase [Mariprofundus ferrooxydans]
MSFWKRKRATASARHILVADRAECEALKAEIEAGADFAELARKHSTCPSASKGGDLGEFRERQMVKEFNDVVFSAELHTVHGPVKTQFGYHLIEITARNK